MVRILAALLAVLLVVSNPAVVGADQSITDTCLHSLTTPTSISTVHVQPESGYQPVLDEIEFARCSIDLNMYFLTDATILDALDRAEARGVRVRVILEHQPFGTYSDQQEMFDRLISFGAEVQWSPAEFQYSHAKYMIADQQVLIVTNQNFTGAGFNSNREFGLVTTQPELVQEAAMVFEADWNLQPIPGPISHLVVSPVNSRDTTLSLINSSKQSIWMYSEVLRDEDITTALSSASDRGVDVRIIVNPSADEDDVPYFLDALGHGVQIRVMERPYVHSKLLIVDGSLALVGSQNYSYTSLNLNREVGVVIDDPINLELVVGVYQQDWTRSVPVDSISRSTSPEIALTHPGWIGKLSCVRWRVV